MMDNDTNIFSTHCVAQRKEIAVKAFMEFLNRCKDLTGIFTAVMSLLLVEGWRAVTSATQYQRTGEQCHNIFHHNSN